VAADGFWRIAVLTVSDGVFRGEREDRSGPALAEAARLCLGGEIAAAEVLPDEPEAIAERLRTLCGEGMDLVLLTGGTGVAPRDRTPEAVAAVAELTIPGLSEKMRADAGKDFFAAYLSRQVAAARGSTLILALPGSPSGAVESFEAVSALLPHAIRLLRGERPAHPPERKS